MPLIWSSIDIPLVGGLNRKADVKALQPPKVSKLENATFSRDGALRKRAGSTAFATTVVSTDYATSLATCRAVGAYDDELLYWTDHFLLSYSATKGAWRYRGFMESWVVSQSKPQKVAGEQTAADRATLSGLTVYAWEDSRGGVHYSAMDATTGLVYTADGIIDASGSRPRCVAVGTKVHVYCISGGNLKVTVFDPTTLAVTLSSTTVVAVGANFYDVCSAAGTAFVVYCVTATTFSAKTVTSAGATINTVGPTAAGGNISAVAVASDNTVASAAVCTDAATNSVTGYGYALPLAGLGGSTTVDTGSATWNAITLAPRPGTSTTFDVYYEKNAAATYNRICYKGSFAVDGTGATSGGGGGALLIRHSALASRAWADGLYTYVHVVQDSTLQSTYFALRSGANSPAGVTICARLLPGTAGGIPARNVLPQVESLGNRQYAWAGLYKTRLDVTRTVTSFPAVYTEKGIESIVYDCNNAHSHRQARKGKAVYVSGGLLWQYDGLAPVEQGFLLYPENVTAVAAGSGGSIDAGSRTYRVYYEWTNAKGEREQSTIGAGIVITTAASDKVTLTVPTLAHTQKSSTNTTGFPRRDVSISVWRTAANPTDQTPFRRVSSPNPTTAGANNGYVANDCTADTVSFVDVMSDATLLTQEIDYQSKGEVENLAPPPASLIVSLEDRIYAAGLEDGSQIWYSKLWFPDGGVAFNDEFTIEVPDEGGAITALGAMNGSLIIFKQQRIYSVSGDGPTNTNQDNTFGQPQLLSADVGCVNQASVVLTPFGLMFQSSKGIYLLSPSQIPEPIGAELDTLGLQTITAATLMPDRYEVRFLCSSGSTLVFNYYAKQWSVFTYTGVGACLYQDTTYVYGTGSTALQEAGFTDNGANYSVALETANIPIGEGPQGWGIVRWIKLLGEYVGAHTLRVSLAYDQDSAGTFSEHHDVAVNADPAPYQYNISPNNPDRHQTIRIRIEDMSSSTDSFILNALSIERGVFKATAKIPSSKAI